MAGATLAPAAPLTVRQAIAEVVAEQTRELGRQCRRAKKGTDPEATHQARVATRRLRAALRVFRKQLVVPGRIGKGLRRLAGRLGAVRDRDVLIALVTARHLAALRGEERERLEAVVAKWSAARDRARKRLAAELGRGRYRRLVAALERLAARPRSAGDPDALAARVLADAVAAQADALALFPAMRAAAPTPADLHALRIGFKRLRYTLDFHAAACGLAYDVERRLARQMQDVLGEIHDRDLLLDRLGRGAGAYAGPWPTLLGRLAAERQSLMRRFLRLRRQWRARTDTPDEPAPESRFVNLEPAPVTLRLVAGGKNVASTMVG